MLGGEGKGPYPRERSPLTGDPTLLYRAQGTGHRGEGKPQDRNQERSRGAAKALGPAGGTMHCGPPLRRMSQNATAPVVL